MFLIIAIIYMCRRRRLSRHAHDETQWPSVEAGDYSGDDSSGLHQAKSVESEGGVGQPAAQAELVTGGLASDERAMHEEWSNGDQYHVTGNETVEAIRDAPINNGDHPAPTSEFFPEFSSGLHLATGSAPTVGQ